MGGARNRVRFVAPAKPTWNDGKGEASSHLRGRHATFRPGNGVCPREATGWETSPKGRVGGEKDGALSV